MIFSDNIQAQNSSKIYRSFNNYINFWENCGEDYVKLPRGAGCMDPLLRLCQNCPVMLPLPTLMLAMDKPMALRLLLIGLFLRLENRHNMFCSMELFPCQMCLQVMCHDTLCCVMSAMIVLGPLLSHSSASSTVLRQRYSSLACCK